MLKLKIAGLILLIFVVNTSAYCQEGEISDICMPACTSNENNQAIIIEAPVIESDGQIIRAIGGLSFFRENKHITAKQGYYNTNTGYAFLEEVNFTTCKDDSPHYKLRAREITLLPNNIAKMRGVGLYIGKTRIFGLPYLWFRTGTGSGIANVFPKPGYDRRDGLTLAQNFSFIDNKRLRISADIKLTTNNGIQSELLGQFGVNGTLSRIPGRYFSYSSFRESALAIPELSDGNSMSLSRHELKDSDTARLRAFGTVSLRKRTYDIRNEGLVIYRQPEIGITYTGLPINLTNREIDPALNILPEAVLSWGRIRETPGPNKYTTRSSCSLTLPIQLLYIGKKTALQPIIFRNWAEYGTGNDYSSSAYALDFSHIFNDDSLYQIRYINRSEYGKTPFEYDDLDVRREIQAGFQTRKNRHVLGWVGAYDFDKSDFYEWEVKYGYITDCLAGSIRWNQRLKRISIDAAIINL